MVYLYLDKCNQLVISYNVTFEKRSQPLVFFSGMQSYKIYLKINFVKLFAQFIHERHKKNGNDLTNTILGDHDHETTLTGKQKY